MTEDDEMFDGLLDKINSRCGNDGSMSSQFARFQASTAFISKIADGYTKNTFSLRKNVHDFLENDVVNDD